MSPLSNFNFFNNFNHVATAINPHFNDMLRSLIGTFSQHNYSRLISHTAAWKWVFFIALKDFLNHWAQFKWFQRTQENESFLCSNEHKKLDLEELIVMVNCWFKISMLVVSMFWIFSLSLAVYRSAAATTNTRDVIE